MVDVRKGRFGPEAWNGARWVPQSEWDRPINIQVANSNFASQVFANATVDRLGLGRYLVRVWDGRESERPETAQNRRDYTIHERSEDQAAKEGIRLFVDEMSGPIPHCP